MDGYRLCTVPVRKHQTEGLHEYRKFLREEVGQRQLNELTECRVKRRKVSDARAIITLRSRDELGHSAAEIARHVGVNTSAITRAIKRAEKHE